ncbi:MAG: leucyl aminopeptidase [Bdellovibrionaceae bacterium]|nr:leucyl aminopeptidase [Pseudobdellovibrionaceae bacterium]|tara:strand:- start:1297 stop:2802 length:1506 start_codon:yes stop_codon:yes gene_type:complete
MSYHLNLEVSVGSHQKKQSSAVCTDLIPVFGWKRKSKTQKMGRYEKLYQELVKTGGVEESASHNLVRLAGKDGARHVYFTNIGNLKNPETLRALGAKVYHFLRSENLLHVRFQLGQGVIRSVSDLHSFRAFLEGMVLASYQFEKKGKTAQKVKPILLTIETQKASQKRMKQFVEDLEFVQQAVSLTRDWSNAPANLGTPSYYAKEAEKLAKELGVKVKILGESEAKKEKMNLFLGVGAGSQQEGKIVYLEYKPKKKSKKMKTIGLVGKGVTFDAGGISLKPSSKMEDMKHDMTGAATIMGAFYLAAKRKVNNRVIAVMGFTENMPSGSAIQPSNVLTARSGQTVEITNTDAEGRLVLGDLLDWIQEFKPDVLLDAATLTGAVGVALGKQCAAILGNQQKWISQVIKSSESVQERLWQLPLYPEYFEDMKSEVADFKNSVNNSLGGTIRGAAFLQQFVKAETPWVHLDIALMSWDVANLAYCPNKGASGLYVRSIAHLVENY